jgi:hypothetical protein
VIERDRVRFHSPFVLAGGAVVVAGGVAGGERNTEAGRRWQWGGGSVGSERYCWVVARKMAASGEAVPGGRKPVCVAWPRRMGSTLPLECWSVWRVETDPTQRIPR